MKFARLTALVKVPAKRVTWLCRCECGKEKAVQANHLSSGAIQSCGCLNSEESRKRTVILHIKNTKTGLSGSATYNVWCGMRSRCQNPRHPFYSYYGGRGIKVCERWQKFENFLADMGEKPKGLSLDRVDNNGNYQPGNCRWASKKVQQNNQRINRRIEFAGKIKTLAEWARLAGIHRNTLERRIANGMPMEKALIPPKPRKKK